MTGDARAFWLAYPGRGEIRPQRLAPAGPDEVLVRTLHTAVSRGTETLVFTGGVPQSQWAAMRAPFQEGDFPGPVKYGYLNVGVVEQGPTELTGKTVFCLYPHQTRYVVPAAHKEDAAALTAMENRCPVETSGEPEPRKVMLGIPTLRRRAPEAPSGGHA